MLWRGNLLAPLMFAITAFEVSVLALIPPVFPVTNEEDVAALTLRAIGSKDESILGLAQVCVARKDAPLPPDRNLSMAVHAALHLWLSSHREITRAGATKMESLS